MTPGRSFLSIQQDIREGRSSCEHRVRYHLSKIAEQTHLNSFLQVYEEEALERARHIDQKIRANESGKLSGLVVAIKDALAHEGHPLQASSRILQGFVSPYSSTAVSRLLAADAIVIGRNNCDEFGMGSSNENSTFGPVQHGTHPGRVPGGSSGGSAVAVMGDMCQVALGSDTGGSVRQPAGFCGVLGLKPTYGRISRHGLVAFASSFDCVGILAKYPEDIALVLEVIAGKDEYDSTVSRRPVDSYFSAVTGNQKKYRFCTLRGISVSATLQSEVREALLTLVERLKNSGHTVHEVDFPLHEYVLPAYYILTTAEASSNLSRYDGVRYGYRSSSADTLETMFKKTRSEGFGSEVKRRIMMGTFVLSSDYHDAYYTRAQRVRRLVRDRTLELFRDCDFILMPTSPTTAFSMGRHEQNPLEMYLADMYSVQANLSGLPALSVPFGADREGLPVGIQLLANRFEEGALLDVTRQIMNLNE